MQYSKASSINSSHDEILMGKLIDKSGNLIEHAYKTIHKHIQSDKTKHITMKLVLSAETHNEVMCFAYFMKCQDFKVEVTNYGENFERAFNSILNHGDKGICHEVTVIISWQTLKS